jgi:hypothetical protein
MNIKNALGFLVLGLLMYSAPTFAQSLSDYSAAAAVPSVRTVWLEFMGWVIGGIGIAYLSREGVVRMPVLVATMVPARLLRQVEASNDSGRIPDGARVGVSS